jgi:hypothetical protein
MSATKTIWICKPDGTIQCEPDIAGTSLQDARKELEAVIGAQHVLNGAKRSRIVIFMCGTPTGSLNAFEITLEGWKLLQTGVVGNLGYAPCGGEPDESGNNRSFAGSLRGSVSLEDLRKELIGRTARYYKTGDGLTRDFHPDRINIEHDGSNKIVDVWFG